VNRAAAALYVHPNTVRYRLGRIAETTGYDPRTFGGLLELVCVIDAIDDDQAGADGLDVRARTDLSVRQIAAAVSA
jgi:hypothetical protein